GGGAETRARPGFTEQTRLVRGEVRRVYRHEARPEQARLGAQLDRTLARLGETRLHFGRLLGDVHVERHLAARGEHTDVAQPFGRHRAHAVRRDPHAHQVTVGVTRPQLFGV